MSRSNAAAALLFRRKGDGSTLNLDFTAMSSLDSRFTFSRSEATVKATYINSSGYVTQVATLGDPRFDYDPTTLAAKGLLIEGSATNYLLRSTTCAGTGWSTGGAVTITNAYATGPDGVANSATRFQMNYSGGGTGRIYQDSGFTTKPYTNSVWIKSNTGSNQTLAIYNTTGTQVSITATPSWQRFENVNTTGTSLAGYFYLENPSTNPAVVVDVLVYGAQLEAGKGASSYIPTVASQVIRAADICTFALTPANIGLTTSPIGTCFYQATANYLPASGYPTIVGFFDSGNNPKAWLSQMSADGNNYSSWKTTTGTVADVTFSAAIVPKTSFKFASSISSTQNLASRNGTAGTAGAVSSAVLSVPTQINFGYTIENITIANFKFFPTTKSQAELNALTT